MRALAVTVGGAAVASAVGWSMFAPVEVSRAQVESGTLARVAAAPSDAMKCAGGLRAQVGAAQECTLTRGGEKFAVSLKVVDVDGDNVNWESVVAADPTTGRRVTAADLEARTREVLAGRGTVGAVTCDGPLPGTVGATRGCTYVLNGKRHHAEVRVTDVGPASVRWGVTIVD